MSFTLTACPKPYCLETTPNRIVLPTLSIANVLRMTKFDWVNQGRLDAEYEQVGALAQAKE